MSIYFRKTYQRSFGTFPLKGQELHDAIKAAAEAGYRAFDTAQMYENEADTGAAIRAAGLARDELCITSKVEIANFGADKFLPSVEESLRRLQIDQLDVLLLHWPAPGGDIRPSLSQLQKACDQGLTKHIGVSNYTAQMMRDAKSIVDAPIVTNQVEFHPLLNQDKLLAAAAEPGSRWRPIAPSRGGRCSDMRSLARSAPPMAKAPHRLFCAGSFRRASASTQCRPKLKISAPILM